jgi:hypothetical protein
MWTGAAPARGRTAAAASAPGTTNRDRARDYRGGRTPAGNGLGVRTRDREARLPYNRKP